MNIERALAIKGWMTDEELRYIAKLANRARCIVEIGSYQGRSTRAFADNTNGIVFSVDTWQMEGREEYDENLKDVIGKTVFPVRTPSLKAAWMFRNAGILFDLIFIDADHELSGVENDILNWRHALSCDGIIFGHDYQDPFPGVKAAVDRWIPKFRTVGSIWTTEGV